MPYVLLQAFSLSFSADIRRQSAIRLPFQPSSLFSHSSHTWNRYFFELLSAIFISQIISFISSPDLRH